jgi:hypothetical protein
VSDTRVAVVGALPDVSFVLNLLRARNLDLLILNVVVELLLALQLRLVLWVGGRVVLLAGVIATNKVGVLL